MTIRLFVTLLSLAAVSACDSHELRAPTNASPTTEIAVFMAYRTALAQENWESATSYFSPRVLQRLAARSVASVEPDDAVVAVQRTRSMITAGDIVLAVCEHSRGVEDNRVRLTLLAMVDAGVQRRVVVWFADYSGDKLIDGFELLEIVPREQQMPCDEGVTRFPRPRQQHAPVA